MYDRDVWSRAFAIAIGCALVACSTPPKRKKPRRRAPPIAWVIASGDPAKPQSIPVERGSWSGIEYGKIAAEAPHAGTWWYVVEFAPLPGRFSTVWFSTSHEGAADLVTFAWLDGEHVHQPTSRSSGVWALELPEAADPLPRYVLRVTTGGPTRFWIKTNRRIREPVPISPPPCDRDNIDPANPNCAGVHPRCDPNDPDFSNPRCCEARCQFGTRRCRGRVLRGGSNVVTIPIGADQELMRYATGYIKQGNRGSDVMVIHVRGHESDVHVLRGNNLDWSTIETTEVVLTAPPEPCRKR